MVPTRCKHLSRTSPSLPHVTTLRDLDGFNLKYLRSLVCNDMDAIKIFEDIAKCDGYGPLIPCDFIAGSSQKTQRCRKLIFSGEVLLICFSDIFSVHFHRRLNGRLDRGELQVQRCPVIFEFFYAMDTEERRKHPFVILVCRNKHSHSPPSPLKTPPRELAKLQTLLLHMKWSLAEATPRKILNDSGFMMGLRQIMNWECEREPSLSDLHPSLANSSHVQRIIDALRKRYFYNGNGFESS